MAGNTLPTEIQEIKQAYKNRTKRKDLFDATVDLSASKPDNPNLAIKLAAEKDSPGTYRLLDEGYIMDTAGNPYLYVAKGVAKKIYNSVKSDFVGRINLGHMSYAEFPYTLGTWTKKDLKVVDMGNGRKALDVKLNIDEESLFIKELKRTGAEIGLSIEMPTTMDWSDETYGVTGVPTIVDAKITAFAIVGDAGNARSGGVKLKTKGDTMSKIDELLAKFGSKKPAETVEIQEETVTLSAEDYKKFEEAVSLATKLMQDAEKADELLAVMDAKIDELTKENEKLKANEAKIEEMTQKMSAIESNTASALSTYEALTAKYAQRIKEKADTEGIELKARVQKGKEVKQYEEISDGFGKEL